MSSSEFEDSYDSDEPEPNAFAEVFQTPLSRLSLRTPLVVEASVTVAEAISAMNEHRTGCVLVGNQGKLAGIFTERDVLRRAATNNDSRTVSVGSVMTADPETLKPDQSIAFALNHMSVGGYRHIPIVDSSGRPIAVVSVRDIVDFLVDLFPADVLNLPPSSGVCTGSVDGG